MKMSCKRIILVLLGLTACLQAQEIPSSCGGVEGTDEISPLFWMRIDLRRTRELDEQNHQSWNEVSQLPPAVQPKPDSFQKLFRTIAQNKPRIPRQSLPKNKVRLSLTLEPAQFALRERREITATLSLTNEGDRQIRVTFPTTQRMILTLRDPTGQVLERWPEGYTAEPIQEVIAINSNEMVQFSQRLPTRAMKASETYSLEASLSNNPQYTQTISLRPL